MLDRYCDSGVDSGKSESLQSKEWAVRPGVPFRRQPSHGNHLSLEFRRRYFHVRDLLNLRNGI